jgi:hypothetical protein
MSDLEALSAELLVTKKVEVAGGKGFAVGGLHLDGILTICRRHREDVTKLFEQVVETGGGLEQAAAMSETVLSATPDIAAEIIAFAAGHPDAAEAVFRKLPFPVQLDALNKIAELTFTSEMPPKKVIETVARTLAGVAKPLTVSAEPQG